MGEGELLGHEQSVQYLHLSKRYKFYTYNECVLFHVNYNSIRLIYKNGYRTNSFKDLEYAIYIMFQNYTWHFLWVHPLQHIYKIMNGNVWADFKTMVSSDPGKMQVGRQIAMEPGIHKGFKCICKFCFKMRSVCGSGSAYC